MSLDRARFLLHAEIMTLTRLVSGLVGVLMLASCQVPALPGLPGRGSVYGDRAGPSGFRSVIIDAGHGGKDSGARSHGMMEKTYALDIAKRVRSNLSPGYRVVMTRTDDRFIELDNRVHVASHNSDAILVSIHLNHGRSYRAGPETYWWRTDSYSLARRFQQQMNAVCPHDSGNAGMVRRRLRLTRNPTIPCVLLECGYLSNSRDARLLATADYRERMAQAIARAIRDQAAYGDAGMGTLPRPIYAPPSKASDARG
jgi:N-acetylmuramoyl-L-alanine amidase